MTAASGGSIAARSHDARRARAGLRANEGQESFDGARSDDVEIVCVRMFRERRRIDLNCDRCFFFRRAQKARERAFVKARTRIAPIAIAIDTRVKHHHQHDEENGSGERDPRDTRPARAEDRSTRARRPLKEHKEDACARECATAIRAWRARCETPRALSGATLSDSSAVRGFDGAINARFAHVHANARPRAGVAIAASATASPCIVRRAS